jgi:uncharacterized membrane protein
MLEFVASFVCHQVPERTMTIGGQLLPLCARCTGIYSGFLIGVVFQAAARKKLNRLPSPWITTVSIVFVLSLITEALGEKLGLWALPSQGRLLLGLFCGSALSLGSFPLFNYFLQRDNRNGSSIGSANYLGLLAFLGLFSCLYCISASFLILSSISFAGIFVCYMAANMTIAGMLVNWRKKASDLRDTLALAGLILTLFIGEAVILGMMG